MSRFGTPAALTVCAATILAIGVIARGGSPAWVLQVLRGLGEDGYALWYVWVLVAPLVLLASGLAVRRTPWPWIVAVFAHLASLVAGAVRVEHWLDWWAWPPVAALVGLGLWSVAAALRRPARNEFGDHEGSFGTLFRIRTRDESS